MKYTNQTVQVPVESHPWFENSFQLRAGVILIAEVALVSFISVAALLVVVTVRTLKRWKRKREGRALADDGPTHPVALLFILAMCMELVQAFGGVMSVRWAWQGATTEGHYCTAQAVLKQLGSDGAALFTMFLAIMTVIPTISPHALSLRQGRRIVLGMIAFVGLFWLFMITVPAKTIKGYYGSTGPWCWIPTKTNGKVLKTNEFMGILSEYGWFWLASLACFICYGYIVIRWWRRADGDSELIKQAVVMVWYPIAYFIEIFPQSVTRLLQLQRDFRGKSLPPHGWTIFTSVLFASSGWVNVLLWVVTGRQYGFSASSSRTLSEDEAAHDQDEAPTIHARGGQIEPNRMPRYGYERGGSLGAGLIPLQPAFPPSSAASDRTLSSSFPTSSRYGLDTLAAYQPGVYDPSSQTSR